MTHASLFSGIGGPEVAAAMLGWENVFHCEINPFGRKILEYWFPQSDSYDDITKTDFTKYRGTVDVLTGGFPCQPFSYAGKRGGESDERYLWPEMLRVIDEVRPAWVVGENVAGITTMVEQCRITDMGSQASLFEKGGGIHRYAAEYTFTIERICKDLESIGYSVQPMLIPACAVGAPHRRDRTFFIANKVADSIEVSRIAENALCDGLRCGQESEQGSERNKRNVGARDSQRICGKEGIDVADTNSGRLERTSERRGERRRNDALWQDRSMLPNNRWAAFPSVSPVHRGDDGLPFDVDNLTIPFSMWRSESLKAYGNAIVPQVMYRIFEAIESL